ncbi:MAG: hypothetical protein AB202_00485 [Parcubacteria bacterium C7867-007]|nr:MAG: hypothetical protein AB202_00485 [Parcubacteria bacterium C7867-007]
MPHVIVHFDPKRVLQSVIDELKPPLQQIVADGLSYTSSDHKDVRVDPKEVYVRQQAAHPTDVNPAAIEIEIQAGKKRERNPEGMVVLMSRKIIESEIIPKDMADLCIWLRFSEDNAFKNIY